MQKPLAHLLPINILTVFLTARPVLAQSESLRRVGGETCPENTINTALGCLSTDPQHLTSQILTLSVGVGGSLALILLLYGFTLLAASAGSPDKVTAAKEIITSAIGGLIFITMATVLMGFIGINVLGLPGLN